MCPAIQCRYVPLGFWAPRGRRINRVRVAAGGGGGAGRGSWEGREKDSKRKAIVKASRCHTNGALQCRYL